MKKVYLVSGVAETALGSTRQNLYRALKAGLSALGTITRYPKSTLTYFNAACMETGAFGKEALDNLTLAILRGVLADYRQHPPIDGIIWAGVKGDVEFIEAGAFAFSSVPKYPYLPRHYSQWCRDYLGENHQQALLMEVGAACASSTQAIALAAQRIKSGRANSVLVVAADIVSRFSVLGFNALLALTQDVCRPFDVNRDGLLLGDGAVAVLLANENYLAQLEQEPLACITGWGVANDATHITAPARDARGLIAAINLALTSAGLAADDIGAFCTHGTGTVYNDAMELTATDAVFGQRRFPLFSIKGAIGHTLGAAGGIEVLVSARALKDHVVPPTAGLLEPEPAAVDRVSPDKMAFSQPSILTTNSGFGGVNVALILEPATGRPA